MQTIDKITNQTLATLARLPTQPSRESESPPTSPSNNTVENPARTTWQRKWLKLDCYREEIQTLVTATEGFCGRWLRNFTSPSLLVLAGEIQCGKTHIATKVFRFATASAMSAFEWGYWGHTRVPTVTFCRWPEAVDCFTADEKDKQRQGLLPELIDTDLLIIDDIGADADPWKSGANKLCQILSRRERRFTLITTNIKPESWSERFDTRIADRLLRNSVVVDLFGLASYVMR